MINIEPNKIISAYQLDAYLRNFLIKTYLDVIHFNASYSLDNYMYNINTNVIYKDSKIDIDDINFKVNTTEQEKYLIVDALNELRERVI